jgi:hypothetical protein
MVIAVVVLSFVFQYYQLTRVKATMICPNITEFDIYPGLDICCYYSLEPLAVDVGRQLEDLVADRYSDTYGWQAPAS